MGVFMNKEQVEILIDTTGNEVVKFLNYEQVIDKDNQQELMYFFETAKINEELN